MNNKNYLVLIRVISVVVPLLVAFLLFFPAKLNLGDWVYHIPAFNALLNTATSILLIAAIIAIKSKNIKVASGFDDFWFQFRCNFFINLCIIPFLCYHDYLWRCQWGWHTLGCRTWACKYK